jgi:hypothetical protein
MTTPSAHQIRPGRIPIRDVSLYIDVVGHGYPLLLMHGGPGAPNGGSRASAASSSLCRADATGAPARRRTATRSMAPRAW